MNFIKYRNFGFIFLIIGITLIIYASVNFPTEIPGYNSTYTGSPESVKEQMKQHQAELTKYQVRSREFIILISGVSIILLGLISCYCYNKKLENYDMQIENNRRIIVPRVNVNRNISKIVPIINQSIVNEPIVNQQPVNEPAVNESVVINVDTQPKSILKKTTPPLESVSPPATLKPPDSFPGRLSIGVPAKIPIKTVRSNYEFTIPPQPRGYYGHLPPNYHKYFIQPRQNESRQKPIQVQPNYYHQ
jgi:hypothetical protein